MLNPLVSILIPCYNAINTIDHTVQSALAQSYTNLEIIINDDCSTDGTYAYLLEKYINHSRIFLSKNDRNLGMCENWNVLFSMAKGEYWLKLDADDLIKPLFIETTLRESIKHQSTFTGTSYQFLDIVKGKTSDVYTHQDRKTGILINPLFDIFINYPFHLCFTLLKADFIKKISPDYFFKDTEVGDAEFQIRAALHADFKGYYVASQLGFYCFHGNNSSLTPLKQARSFMYDVVNKHHKQLINKLGWPFRQKMISNFKIYCISMIKADAPWDFKLLITCLKYAFK